MTDKTPEHPIDRLVSYLYRTVIGLVIVSVLCLGTYATVRDINKVKADRVVIDLDQCKSRWFVELTWTYWFAEFSAVSMMNSNQRSLYNPDSNWLKEANVMFELAVQEGQLGFGAFDKLNQLERCEVLVGYLGAGSKAPKVPSNVKPIIKEWLVRQGALPKVYNE